MSHEVELTKERASAVMILKASRPLMSKEKKRMPGLWLVSTQRSKDGLVFHH
jgi:hypothetical protein